MAIQVVEGLEPVDVELDQCAGRAGCRQLDGALHRVVQAALIACLGLDVVVDKAGEGVFGGDAGSNVLHGAFDPIPGTASCELEMS